MGGSGRIPFLDLATQHQPLRQELQGAFDRLLSSSAFILGEEVEAFEQAFATYCGTSYCIGVNSGTAALQIMLEAAGVGAGDEVIVPAHTFIATALAVRHTTATPVCVDVLEPTGLIDPDAVAAAIGPRTAAILAVHLYGQTCQMDALQNLARRHGLLLFEDAAQAHGARYGEERAGSLGTAAAFSFYPSKNLGALGDGGAICTNDPDLDAAARRLRDLGRCGGPEHDLAGYNERLDGLQAAFLSIKLPHLDAWNEARRRAAADYEAALGGAVDLLEERHESPCIYHLYPIRVRDRKTVADALAANGIASGIHYPATLADQAALPELAAADVPVARTWAARELSLPIFPTLDAPSIARIGETLRQSSAQLH